MPHDYVLPGLIAATVDEASPTSFIDVGSYEFGKQDSFFLAFICQVSL